MAAFLPVALLALLVGALVALLVAELTGSRTGLWLTKPVASLAFVGLALVWGATDTTFGRWIFAGLVLSWLGDVLLIPEDERAFLGGLVAFLLAHVAYGVAFVVLAPSWPSTLAAVAGLALVAVSIARWLLPHVERGMRGPVVAYMVVITGMVALAVGAWRSGASVLLLGGALAFYLSDLTVARDRFVTGAFANRLVGLPLYYGAQVMLAASVLSVG